MSVVAIDRITHGGVNRSDRVGLLRQELGDSHLTYTKDGISINPMSRDVREVASREPGKSRVYVTSLPLLVRSGM